MNKIVIATILIVLSLLIWVAICFGLTYGVLWIANGFSIDLTEKFWYIFVGLLIITYIFRK